MAVILGWVGGDRASRSASAVILLPGNLTTNGHVTGNPESKQAEDLFGQRFPPDKNGVDELIVVRSRGPDRGAIPAFKSFARRRSGRKANATGVVYRLTPPARPSRTTGTPSLIGDPAAGGRRPAPRPRRSATTGGTASAS